MTLNRFGALFLSYKLGVHCLAGLEVFVRFLGTSLAREAESQTQGSLSRLLPCTQKQTHGLLGIFR